MSYVELHCHSGFSFLDGASSPDDLAAAAAAQGHEALAITDHDGVWGAMEFAAACKPLGVRPIVGTELSVAEGDGNGAFHLTLLVESAEGWRNLCLLLTEAHAHTRPVPGREALPPLLPSRIARAARRRAGLPLGLRARRRAGRDLRAGGRASLRLRRTVGRGGGRAARGAPSGATGSGLRSSARCGATTWRATAGSRASPSAWACRASRRATCTRTIPSRDAASGCAGGDPAGRVARRDGVASPRQLARGAAPAGRDGAALFAEHPDAVAESERLAERLRFDLTTDHGYRYPGAEDEDADRELAELCAARFEGRYAGTPERAEARRRLDEELSVIRKLRLSGFFLLHADLLELAREVAREVRGPESARGVLPPGRGRGSSVSSVVCYLTGPLARRPGAAGLFLGRFLNEELTDAPDIDLDFPRDVREQLIPRIHERYGRERSALVCAFPTFRVKGAVRELGKALGLPPTEIERVARAVDGWAGENFEADVEVAVGEQARAGAALEGTRAPGARGLGAAAPRLAALRRDGARDHVR